MYPNLTDDIFKQRYFARRSTGLQLAPYTGVINTSITRTADVVDIMLNTEDMYIISRTLEVVAAGSTLVLARYLSFPVHNDNGTPISHVSQTLAPPTQIIPSRSRSQINPTLTSVGFVGDPFYVRSAGVGGKQLSAVQGNLGLLFPNLTIALRIQNLDNAACEIDSYFTFSEIKELSGSRSEP